jgi:hypothetical protein
MSLFDSVPSVETGPSGHGKPYYDYLCRTGRPSFIKVRELVESWVSEFPWQHRKEITRRLRNRDNHHFQAAFFELYLHALFRGLGYAVRVHPRAGSRNKRPDFLIRENRRGLLIEAASVTEVSDKARAEQSRLSAAFDALNRVHCPDYLLNVEHYGELTSPLPGDKLRHKLRIFLGGLDYEAVRNMAKRGLPNLPHFDFLHESFRLHIGVIPVSPQRRGDPEHRPLGMLGPGEARCIDHHTPIRESINHKAKHYGHLRRPLVIAINAAGGPLDSVDVMQALFGSERLVFSRLGDNPNEATLQRAPDGAWIGSLGPRNRNVSAVFFISSLLPWTVAIREPVIYHNPWAHYPANGLPDSINQFRLDGQQMVSQTGRPLHELLTLPQDWPHFDRD